jgi:poly-beta-hydroxyalkanoate depolymerase
LAGYEYALDAGAFQTATQFTGLSAGTYSVYTREISDPACVSLATMVTVTQPSVPAIATVAITSQPTCAVPTGGLVITSPIGAYEYSVGGGGIPTVNQLYRSCGRIAYHIG